MYMPDTSLAVSCRGLLTANDVRHMSDMCLTIQLPATGDSPSTVSDRTGQDRRQDRTTGQDRTGGWTWRELEGQNRAGLG